MAPKQLMTADEITRDPGTWKELRRQGIGASEIPAMLGICPPQHGSPFALFVSKTTGEELTGDTDAMSRGRHLEPYVADRLEGMRPELAVMDGGLFQSRDHPWMLATFDRLALDKQLAGLEREVLDRDVWIGQATYPVQIKTSVSRDNWGEPGTDQIPGEYRAQVLQEMAVWDAQLVIVPVLFVAAWKVSIYAVTRDEDAEADMELIRAEGERFMNRIADNDPPPVDWTPATTRALHTILPDTGPDTARVTRKLAEKYRNARRMVAEADRRLGQATNELLAQTGGAKKIIATYGGEEVEVATRRRYARKTISTKALRERYPEIAKEVERSTDVDALWAGRWAAE